MDRRKFARCCIICIGSTGTGKSTTIQTCTLQEVHTSAGSKSDTVKCEKYEDLRNPGGAIWVDSVGWDDTEGRNDQQSFQDVLKFISSNGCTKICAVIWTVNPDIRESQTLQRQAEFINQFADRDIWRNVLVIAKASENTNACCQGALAAAKRYSKGIRVMTLSYKYIENADMGLQAKLQNDSTLRQLTNFFTKEEVYQLIRSKLDLVEEPVQVLFNDKQCLDCGVQGDERLLPEKCHLEKQLVHGGCLQKLHPGQVENAHVSTLEKKHTGDVEFESGEDKGAQLAHGITNEVAKNVKGLTTLAALKSKTLGAAALVGDGILSVAQGITGVIKEANRSPDVTKYTCCGREQGREGCVTVWKCCGKEEEDPGCKKQYSCCKLEVAEGLNNGCERLHECCNRPEGREGCKATCRLCDNPWCDPKTVCFKKKHNLVNSIQLD